jgi:hypothetical protein
MHWVLIQLRSVLKAVEDTQDIRPCTVPDMRA